MYKRFKRANYKSLKEEIETDKKNVDVFTSADGSVTVVKKEEIRKNYRNNKLIKNDEDSKIIQDFCRKHLHYTKKKEKEEKVEDDKKEEEVQSTSKRGYFSKYRRNLKKQKENESSNISPEKPNSINENSDKNNNNNVNQTEQNKEESNSSRKYHRRRFFKKSENSNQNETAEKDNSNQNKVNINSIPSEKDKKALEEINVPLRFKRKKYNSEEKKEKFEEKKPKFVPTYHEKRKYVENDSQMDKYSNLKNYKSQILEAIPVKFCDDYYDYGYNSRMRFLSPLKTLYVQPFLNPNIIITKIKLDDNYLQSSNIGYASGINNNVNYYRNNISRNNNSYNNNNLFGREIFKSQYKTEYKYIHPFSNIDNSRNVGL